MKKTSIFIISFVFISCGIKRTQNLLTAGNYDEVISNSISGLRNNKDKKSNQEYVYLLEEAFAKGKERDLNDIDLLEKDKNSANFEKIYTTYLQLLNRQEKIKPLLPIRLLNEGRNAIFLFDNYSDRIIASKDNLAKYLYDNAQKLLATSNKLNYRKAYDDLMYLNQINPNYKNASELVTIALTKGIDYVHIYTKNETNLVIPARLESDLLDFSSYGINSKWTVFHGFKQKNIKYDYTLIISFRDILISPEQIKEREFIKERQIKEGQKRLLDSNGREIIDSTGKVVMVDNLITVAVRIFEFRQFKSAQVQAKIDYLDTKTNQLLQSFPISSEYIFENMYSNFKGDRRAAEDNYNFYFDRRSVAFPSNEQMICSTGENLKLKIKNSINQNRLGN